MHEVPSSTGLGSAFLCPRFRNLPPFDVGNDPSSFFQVLEETRHDPILFLQNRGYMIFSSGEGLKDPLLSHPIEPESIYHPLISTEKAVIPSLPETLTVEFYFPSP